VKRDLQLAMRVYDCDNCGISIDRDHNAAFNLKKYGEMYVEEPTVAASWAETLNACGDHVRPSDGRDPDDEGNDDEA